MAAKVSVLMGIYNCEATLTEALDSLMNQSFTDWELILCDDGSGDQTCRIALEYVEKYPGKIKLIQNEKNMGLNVTLNRCLELAEGTYIARMDGDDISLPQRFGKELAFLEAHTEYDWVSCPMYCFDEKGVWKTGRAKSEPQAQDFIPGTPFCHAPCMIRTEAIRTVGGYDESAFVRRVEDYDLWFRLYAQGFRGANLTEPLYMMRDDENAYKRRKFRYALNEAYVRYRGYRLLGLGWKSYLYVIRPILVNLLPKPVYMFLHQRKK